MISGIIFNWNKFLQKISNKIDKNHTKKTKYFLKNYEIFDLSILIL